MPFKWDAIERVFWTLVQATLGVVTVEMLEVAPEWIPLVAGALSVAKTFVGRKVTGTGAVAPDVQR